MTLSMNVSQRLGDDMLKDLLSADVVEANFVTNVLPDSASTSPLMMRKTSVENGLRKTDMSPPDNSKPDEELPAFGFERKLSVEWLNEHDSINSASQPGESPLL